MAIWKETIRHGDPELYGKLKYSYWEPVEKAGARISALRRTLISDPSVHDFYVKLRAAGRLPGLGPAAIKLLQMLLAGTHRDLMEPDWPEKVLEFMGDSNAKA